MRLPDRDGLPAALIVAAARVIKLDASTLYLEKPVKAISALQSLDTSTKVIPRRRRHG